VLLLRKQGVALTGRNTTGPPCSVTDGDKRQRAKQYCPIHLACSEIRSRVLRSATVPFFYDKKNGTVALRSTLERISEHAHCVVCRRASNKFRLILELSDLTHHELCDVTFRIVSVSCCCCFYVSKLCN